MQGERRQASHGDVKAHVYSYRYRCFIDLPASIMPIVMACKATQQWSTSAQQRQRGVMYCDWYGVACRLH
jgi:hypothetical protein